MCHITFYGGSWKKALHATFPCMSFGRDSDNKNGSIVLVWQLSRYYYTMLWKRPQVQKQVLQHCYARLFFISFDLILQLVQLLNALGKESCSTYTNSTLFWTLAHKQITHIFPLACQVVISDTHHYGLNPKRPQKTPNVPSNDFLLILPHSIFEPFRIWLQAFG